MADPKWRAAAIPVNEPRTNREYVMQRISDDILFGELKPGQRISPEAVGRECGISHIPVREALGELEGRGYLVRMGNRGYFVPELAIEELEDIYRVREILENAANAAAIPLMTSKHFDEMRHLLTRMRRARRDGDWRSHATLNREFHFVPFMVAGGPKLLEILAHLWDMGARYQVAYFTEEGRARTVGDQHRAILEAYRAHDVDLVNKLMREHRSVTIDAFRKYAEQNIPSRQPQARSRAVIPRP
jgi:DNA-binding GntR family transcriptional regulator